MIDPEMGGSHPDRQIQEIAPKQSGAVSTRSTGQPRQLLVKKVVYSCARVIGIRLDQRSDPDDCGAGVTRGLVILLEAGFSSGTVQFHLVQQDCGLASPIPDVLRFKL